MLTMVQPEMETALHARALSDGNRLGAPGDSVARITASRVSASPHDDLVLYDGPGKLLIVPGEQDAWTPISLRDSKGETAVLQLPVSLVDLLSMRLNADGLSDLVLLRRDPQPILIFQTTPARTITVDRDGDQGDFSGIDGRCDIDNDPSNGAGCTLKAALSHASTFAVEEGLSEIVFSLKKLENAGTAFAFRPVLINGGGVEIVGRIRLAGTDSVIRDVMIHAGPSPALLSRLEVEGSKMTVERCRIGFARVQRDGTEINIASSSAIDISGNDNTIGGLTEESRNVTTQISLLGNAADNKILGNHIWVNEAGDQVLGFDGSRSFFDDGIVLNSTGSNEIRHNLVSGAVDGIFVSSRTQGNVIRDNKIGTDKEGLSPLANERHGVRIQDSNFNMVEDNLIAFNAGDGISTAAAVSGPSVGNRFLRNRIHSNGGLGIDLGDDGISENDDGDADSGANNLLNFPILETQDGSVVASLPVPEGQYRIEFFANTSCDDSKLDSQGQPHGEGETFLGALDDREPGMAHTFPVPSLGDRAVSATVTDAEGNTSEFSACLFARPPHEPIIVNSFGDADDAQPQDGVCNTGQKASNPEQMCDPTIEGDCECTLRAAIMQANGQKGSDQIHFNIPSDQADERGVFPIFVVDQSLPPITEELEIDGYTQPGTSKATASKPATILIEIEGGFAGDDAVGLRLAASNSIVRGLSISSFTGGALLISGNDNTVQGCLIGLDASGEPSEEVNAEGIVILSSRNLIGGTTPADRNIVSGNTVGVRVFDGDPQATIGNNVIQGNFIGTDETGSHPMENSTGGGLCRWKQQSRRRN